MCTISRKDSIEVDSRFHVFFKFLPTVPRFEADRLLFLIGSTGENLSKDITEVHELCPRSQLVLFAFRKPNEGG
jgi:hypothetical protein